MVKTDFESFMDDLVTPVLDKMNTQKDWGESDKKVERPVDKPFDFNIPPESYGHDCIIHVPGLFSAYVCWSSVSTVFFLVLNSVCCVLIPISWRSEVPAGCVRFGDMIRKGYDLPVATTTLARDHPALIKPTSYTLVLKQERGGA